MKKYKDIGIYDFSDYAEEITGEDLIKINGGSSSCNGGGGSENGGSSASSGGSGSKGSGSSSIEPSSGSCGGGGSPSVPSGSSGNSGSGSSTSGSGSGSAPSSNTGNCGGSISSGADPNVSNPGTSSGSAQTSSEYHGVPPQHWAALDEQKEKNKDYYSSDWIRKIPLQNQKTAQEYVDKKNKEHKENIYYLASTVYGEARGENITTKTVVAWSIRNRAEIKKTNIYDIVTKKSQYNCWDKGDPNYKATTNPLEHARKNGNWNIWRNCLNVSKKVLESSISDDASQGATHYYDKSIDSNPPDWSKSGYEPNVTCIPIENVLNIRFFKGVRF